MHSKQEKGGDGQRPREDALVHVRAPEVWGAVCLPSLAGPGLCRFLRGVRTRFTATRLRVRCTDTRVDVVVREWFRRVRIPELGCMLQLPASTTRDAGRPGAPVEGWSAYAAGD